MPVGWLVPLLPWLFALALVAPLLASLLDVRLLSALLLASAFAGGADAPLFVGCEWSARGGGAGGGGAA